MTYMFFPDYELYCQCGKCEGSNRVLMDSAFMRKLVELRTEMGFPFPVTSAYRCPSHNNNVSRSGFTGAHTTGKAIDINVTREQAHALLKGALEAGFTGIGVNQKGANNNRFIHLDTLSEGSHPRPTVWTY